MIHSFNDFNWTMVWMRKKKKVFGNFDGCFLEMLVKRFIHLKNSNGQWSRVFLRDACVVFGYDIKWHPFDAILKVATHKSHRIIVWFYWFFVFSLFCFTFLFFFFWYNLIIFWVYLFISPFNNLNLIKLWNLNQFYHVVSKMPEIFWFKVSLKLQKIILGQWINGLYISLQIMAERAEMNKPCSVSQAIYQ